MKKETRFLYLGVVRSPVFGDECDRSFLVMNAIARVGPVYGDMNISVMVVMLSMPYTYRFRDRLFFVMGAIALI